MTEDSSYPRPIPLDEPSSQPLTVLRVLVIAALVAFVIGCIPALGTAIIYGANLKDQAHTSAVENCKLLADGRRASNLKNQQMKLNLQADIDLYSIVIKFTPEKVPPGSGITQAQLDSYLRTLNRAVQTKRDKVLPLTQNFPVPDCSKVI